MSDWSRNEFPDTTRQALLESIWSIESTYKHVDRFHDHRRHLSQRQLERILLLAQRLVEMRSSQRENVPVRRTALFHHYSQSG